MKKTIPGSGFNTNRLGSIELNEKLSCLEIVKLKERGTLGLKSAQLKKKVSPHWCFHLVCIKGKDLKINVTRENHL